MFLYMPLEFRTPVNNTYLFRNNTSQVYVSLNLIGSITNNCNRKWWNITLYIKRKWRPTQNIEFRYHRRKITNVSIGMDILSSRNNEGTYFRVAPYTLSKKSLYHCYLKFSYQNHILDTDVPNCVYHKDRSSVTCTNNVNTVRYKYYPNTNNSWNTANTFCKKNHNNLVSIDSPQAIAAIKAIMTHNNSHGWLHRKLIYVSHIRIIHNCLNILSGGALIPFG